MEIEIINTIQRVGSDLKGVFALSDLRVAIKPKSNGSFYRRIEALTKAGILLPIMRGFYAMPDASLKAIVSRIEPNSYISTGTILAENAAIGTVPARLIQAVRVGSPGKLESPLGTIEFFSIAPRLYMGFTCNQGLNEAILEKAFLDTCYFTYKGRRFVFDPASDINLDQMDPVILDELLKAYDKRFISFYRKIWG
ncbi:MAG: hypothetical protein ACYTGH_18600 [Planctomycetota bacterium]|jgi:hypothetical protein